MDKDGIPKHRLMKRKDKKVKGVNYSMMANDTITLEDKADEDYYKIVIRLLRFRIFAPQHCSGRSKRLTAITIIIIMNRKCQANKLVSLFNLKTGILITPCM